MNHSTTIPYSSSLPLQLSPNQLYSSLNFYYFSLHVINYLKYIMILKLHCFSGCLFFFLIYFSGKSLPDL